MSGESNAAKRRDIVKLIANGFEVEMLPDGNAYAVKFKGPTGTPYEGGIWKIRVQLPDNYPFSSPSIGFMNKIFHPNIDEKSGSVCLDVINQTWSPLFNLQNIFECFLPQLLAYPNPVDPINAEAAALFIDKPGEFHEMVSQFVRKYATEETYSLNGAGIDCDSESSLSELE
ncbi:hypothetical protein R5R35_001414 [Gryllus longicercus]|uniref:Ubiquitin-conjugating enzyme E2 H n=1 Tax=Gryllus longicercus TaxID=2509291 RepID=A0AAN9VXZ2_9ORTH